MSKISNFCWIIILIIIFFLGIGHNFLHSQSLSFSFRQLELKNGLKVILSEDHSLPVVSVLIAYQVGSINDAPQKEGLAYLLQNMMFQGSENVGKMQHLVYINQIGGELNAVVYEDKTFFYQTLPSNYLALALWLEADRMVSLRISPSEFEELKNTLILDIKNRIENQPYLSTFFKFDQIAYQDFAYGHPVIGRKNKIKTISLEDAKEFYSTYYVPNNAVLTVVGDFNLKKTIQLIKKYFETIPRGENILSLPPAPIFRNEGIIETYQDSFIPLPSIHIGYFIPFSKFEDFYPLTILDYILLKGESSRLFNRLVKKERLVFQISGGIEKKRNQAIFKIFVINNNPIMVNRTIEIIFSEINKLKKGYVSESELQRAKNMFKADYYNQFLTTLNRAIFLTECVMSDRPLESIKRDLDKYLSVTKLDLMKVINRYFIKKNRIILKVIPK
ncbi:MAG: M16 family metallopeptidase [Candidatus Aminicenantia bacterium]